MKRILFDHFLTITNHTSLDALSLQASTFILFWKVLVTDCHYACMSSATYMPRKDEPHYEHECKKDPNIWII